MTSEPGDHAVAPFKAYAANQVRNFYQISKRSGPVGDRKSSIVAGDRRAKHDDDEGKARGEHRESMMGAVVRCGDGLQNKLLGPVRLLSGRIIEAFSIPDSRERACTVERAQQALVNGLQSVPRFSNIYIRRL